MTGSGSGCSQEHIEVRSRQEITGYNLLALMPPVFVAPQSQISLDRLHRRASIDAYFLVHLVSRYLWTTP